MKYNVVIFFNCISERHNLSYFFVSNNRLTLRLFLIPGDTNMTSHELRNVSLLLQEKPISLFSTGCYQPTPPISCNFISSPQQIDGTVPSLKSVYICAQYLRWKLAHPFLMGDGNSTSRRLDGIHCENSCHQLQRDKRRHSLPSL